MKPTNQSLDLNDDDIRALFDARTPIGSPADLDARILAAAKAEVDGSTNPKPIRAPRSSVFGTWMAVAAVCLLAVILVPVMQQSHETILGSPPPTAESFNDNALPLTSVTSAEVTDSAQDTSDTNEPSRDTVEPNGVSIVPTLSSQVSQEQVAKTDNAEINPEALAERSAMERETLAPGAEHRAAAKSHTRSEAKRLRDSAVLARPEQALQEIDAMTDEEIRQTFESHPYRQERESWLEEIQRLESIKDTLEVVREKRLFERMYPEVQ